tara:strand:- start:244 stop:444 length:201 start_codon:yes stop_codon:yes gene_type:complete
VAHLQDPLNPLLKRKLTTPRKQRKRLRTGLSLILSRKLLRKKTMRSLSSKQRRNQNPRMIFPQRNN